MFQSFRESAGYHGDNNCDFCGFHAGWMSWPVHSHSSQHHGKNFNNLCITQQKHHRCVFTGLNVKRMLWLLWYFSFKYSLRYICVKNNLSAHFQAFFSSDWNLSHHLNGNNSETINDKSLTFPWAFLTIKMNQDL